MPPSIAIIVERELDLTSPLPGGNGTL